MVSELLLDENGKMEHEPPTQTLHVFVSWKLTVVEQLIDIYLGYEIKLNKVELLGIYQKSE